VFVNPAFNVPVQRKKMINIGYINELRIFRAEKCRVYEHISLLLTVICELYKVKVKREKKKADIR
jgi:hypothetical protein